MSNEEPNPSLPDQAVSSSDRIPEDIPFSVPQHVRDEAEKGNGGIDYDEMRVEDAYDDVNVIQYRWDADDFSDLQREDLVDLVESMHSEYDSIRDVISERDNDVVIRLDYT